MMNDAREPSPVRRTARRVSRWLIGSLAIAITATFAQVASADCKIGLLGELNVATTNNQVMADGAINGEAIHILLDTGSAFSFLWESAARRLKLPLEELRGARVYGVGGEVASFRTTIKHLQMGSFYANDVAIVVLGDKGRPESAPAFVFGDDLFSHFDTEFDLAHGKVRLLRPQGCKLDQLPYWTHTYSQADLDGWNPVAPKISTRVLVNGKPVSAQLDTGAWTSAITRGASERAGVRPWLTEPHPAERISGLNGNTEEVWIGSFDTFAMGDESIQHVKLRVSDMFRQDREVSLGSHIAKPIDGLPTMLIGADFFLAHRMLVLSREHKILFTYNGGPIFLTVRGSGPAPESPPPVPVPTEGATPP
jgi:predicted aspartyl protease